MGCRPAGDGRCRPVTRQQAVEALRQQVPACGHCRPDTALGILDCPCGLVPRPTATGCPRRRRYRGLRPAMAPPRSSSKAMRTLMRLPTGSRWTSKP
ncbi:DUF6233 domain-containing protein [Streptomyces pseudogriseolus]|uniref:DUF6233 domain-containing protein n=1 Tax=Streptomyces pseudogriseolus TaxID=36817 RepID=UPI003FA1D6E0